MEQEALVSLVPLVDEKTGNLSGKFSSTQVVEEEKRILRLADRIHEKKLIGAGKPPESFRRLNAEQAEAFTKILNGRRMACVDGYAGTGKSHLLSVLKDVYSSTGYAVRAFGPDSATADVLKEKGFENAENIYRFLFAVHNGKRRITQGKEVWILDEAGKLHNRPLLEFLKEAEKKNVQVIFSGDAAQLHSVERGGCSKFSAIGMDPMFSNRFRGKQVDNIDKSPKICVWRAGSD